MANSLITTNVWRTLSSHARKTRRRSIVAVAYFGKGGARLLPLRKGSLLLVDASETTVKCGQTSPAELLKLYHKGVHIYSKACLHAKIYILGNRLFVGSANVSNHSKNTLTEILYSTTEPQSISSAKDFIFSFCRLPYGEEKLKRLQKLYRPPSSKIRNTARRKSSIKNDANFYTAHIALTGYNEEEEKNAKIGYDFARKNHKKKARHVFEDFIVNGDYGPKINDYILQIDLEGKKQFVCPVGRLIHKRTWKTKNDKKRTTCIIEIENKKRKNWNLFLKKLSPIEKRSITKDKKQTKAFADKIFSLWKLVQKV